MVFHFNQSFLKSIRFFCYNCSYWIASKVGKNITLLFLLKNFHVIYYVTSWIYWLQLNTWTTQTKMAVLWLLFIIWTRIGIQRLDKNRIFIQSISILCLCFKNQFIPYWAPLLTMGIPTLELFLPEIKINIAKF